jgi:hypothetical protein
VGIGGSIFLIALGAILTWAVHLQAGWLDLRVVGVVLMLAGVVCLVLTLWLWSSRRRRVVTEPAVTQQSVPVQQRQRVTYDEPVPPEDPRY